MNLIEGLTNFNLTKQEATLYVLLLKSGQLTGYEAAKQTGISRSNTYTALAGLVEKSVASCLVKLKLVNPSIRFIVPHSALLILFLFKNTILFSAIFVNKKLLFLQKI